MPASGPLASLHLLLHLMPPLFIFLLTVALWLGFACLQVCVNFGSQYNRSRGMYFTRADRGMFGTMVYNWPHSDVHVIVVTDGSRILGLVSGCPCWWANALRPEWCAALRCAMVVDQIFLFCGHDVFFLLRTLMDRGGAMLYVVLCCAVQGDLGAHGMGIPIGKLALYCAAGGIAPHRVLPSESLAVCQPVPAVRSAVKE